MDWFNWYGLIIVAIIMIPNIIFANKNKGGFVNNYKNKVVEILEQIGRYGCMCFMVFNIPHTWFGFFFSLGETVYIAVNAVLLLDYILAWIVLWKKRGIIKAVLLSVTPSLIFLFSGIMIVSIPLMFFAVIFAVTHILISIKNVILADNN